MLRYPEGIKTQHTFTVVSRVPSELQALARLSSNLSWLFDPRVLELFRQIDPVGMTTFGLDPLGILNRCSGTRLAELAHDAVFVANANALAEQMEKESAGPGWARTSGAAGAGSELPLVAYFSPEFGLAASVPQYSGGLGVLAGDHLKAAADLHVPIVGIGLFYRSGYFRQVINAEGRQIERFPSLHPSELALTQVDDLRVSLQIGDAQAEATIWRASVGPNSLYLLDTQIPGEVGPDQLVNDRLYGGGSEERIRQEILLGIGGYRALRALGIEPEVFHLNEGHAGFLSLERIRVEMTEHGLSFDQAVEAVRPSMVFTTHTPVPAGIDRFPLDLMRRYFGWWCNETGVPMATLLALGSEPGGDPEVFNLAHMSLRLCGHANGVSKLHGEVSRNMFSPLWPEFPTEDVPIGSVTNGVHAPTFMAPEIRELLVDTVGEDWELADRERFRAVHAAPDARLWAARNAGRARLVEFVRARARRKADRYGGDEADGIENLLDPDVLTIGFARRFATYKRATLLLTDQSRLRQLLGGDRPIQLLFSGKAHPADEPGKGFLQEVAHLAEDPQTRDRVVFLEDYDLDAGRMLTRGVDVWLNTPLRPMEACGTSGMKAALNGVLNLSVRDGWWDEAFAPDLGWAIPTTSHESLEPQERDQRESAWLYDLIEREVIPAFYDRDAAGIPRGWTHRMASCLEHLVPEFHAGRMVREYVQDYYLPSAIRTKEVHGGDGSGVLELAAFKSKVRQNWPAVQVLEVSTPVDSHVDEEITVHTTVSLGGLDPSEVHVQLLVGEVDMEGELSATVTSNLTLQESVQGDAQGCYRYSGSTTCDHPGTMGYQIRIVPDGSELHQWTEIGLVRYGA